MLLGVGGSNNLETYAFSDTVNRVLEELGVDLEKLEAACEPNYILSDFSSYGLFLNAKLYGKDRLVEGSWQSAWQGEGDVAALVRSLGLPAEQQQRLVALIEGERDLLDDLSDTGSEALHREYLVPGVPEQPGGSLARHDRALRTHGQDALRHRARVRLRGGEHAPRQPRAEEHGDDGQATEQGSRPRVGGA